MNQIMIMGIETTALSFDSPDSAVRPLRNSQGVCSGLTCLIGDYAAGLNKLSLRA
jgi:hypothetical protein